MPFNNLEKNREYHRQYYQANKVKRLEQNKKWEDKKRKEFKEYKEKLVCLHCGENDPICLEFHHLDPSKKDVNVSIVVGRWSTKKIKEEINKCVVLCANCHKKEHARLKA